MRYLGIDYGTKRIGLAVSDDEGRIAFPLTTVAAGKEALAQVATIAKEQKVEMIVLGESRDFKQQENPVMKKIEEFKKALEGEGLSVSYEPEFMTSAAAGREGETPKEKLDTSAAALILQSFLDRKRGTIAQ